MYIHNLTPDMGWVILFSMPQMTANVLDLLLWK